MSERNYEIHVDCRMCRKSYKLKVRYVDYLAFYLPNRPHVQDIFPYLTPAERELLISGTCEECWKKLFADFDEEDSDNE